MTAMEATTHTCWTAEYLLAHCERYRIATPERVLGYVDEVILRPDGRRAAALLVRTEGAKRVAIPVEDVLEVHPSGERIVVRPSRPAPGAPADRGRQTSWAAPAPRRATPASSAARATASATAGATSRLKTLGIT